MSDGTAPTPTPEPAESAAPAPAPAPQPKDGQPTEDWEKRFLGAQRVLSQQDLELKDLRAKLGTTESSLKELQTQLAANQIQFETQLKGTSEQLSTVAQERDATAQRLKDLEAYRIKMEALREFPDLIPLADTIPSLPDSDTMKSHLGLMMKGVDQIASQKAQRLTAGLTPGGLPPANVPKYAYATQADWIAALNNVAGKPEYKEMSAAWRKWEAQQNK